MFSGANLCGFIYSRIDFFVRILWCSDLGLPFGTRLGAGGTPAYAAAVTVADFETKKDEVFAKFRRNRSFSSSSIHMLFDRH